MLRLLTNNRSSMCDRLSRRDFLQIGALGLGGLTLADLLHASATNPNTGSYLKDKSIVLLFLAGGPSQYETFDPKPDGQENSTSIAGHIPTSLPGVRLASYLPKLAKLADRMTIVRSFQTNHAEHDGAHKQFLTADLNVKDGQPISEPGLGAVYARAAGITHPETGLPRHIVIPPTLKYPGAGKGFTPAWESVVAGTQPAHLGPDYAPVEILVPMAGGAAERKKKKNEPDTPRAVSSLRSGN